MLNRNPRGQLRRAAAERWNDSQMNSVRWTARGFGAFGAIASVVLISGCITVNLQQPEPTIPATPTTEEFDDSGALSLLGMAMGGLFGYIEKHDYENCDYISFVASQAGDSTPAPSYQGKYESIATNLDVIGALCLSNLEDQDAINLAVITRREVVAILNDRRYLGSSNWGDPEPVPGAQR